MRRAVPITLSAKERARLRRLAGGRKTPTRLVERARIVLMAGDAMENKDIAAELGISRPTVQVWRNRFAENRIAGIEKDATRPGRIPKLSARKIREVIKATLEATPRGETHWSTRTMSEAQGISRMAVQRIWKTHQIKPHLVETFKLSRDPRFVEKLTDVVGLYLAPPDRALVLCVDEKSQIQALERSQPMLPLRPCTPARQTHDYKRHGTTTLFAALSMLDGTVISSCMPRHRHQEFLKFLRQIDKETDPDLEIHLIVDNYCTHKHEKVYRWLARHDRFHLHFIPTSTSWLNLVERWFREITEKAIRRGSFQNVPELEAAIRDFISAHNDDPKPFVWTATVEQIMFKIAKSQEVLGTLH